MLNKKLLPQKHHMYFTMYNFLKLYVLYNTEFISPTFVDLKVIHVC